MPEERSKHIEPAISGRAPDPFVVPRLPISFFAAVDDREAGLRQLRSGNHHLLDALGGVLAGKHVDLVSVEAGAVDEAIKIMCGGRAAWQ